MISHFSLILALIAFAANSVLCRLALANEQIDPSGFTIIRLLSGALVLVLIFLMRNKQAGPIKRVNKGSWGAAFALFVYALGFSFAYVALDTGTGALILFASVQLSMITWALFKGERLAFVQIIGLLSAFAGLTYLLLPTISTPSVIGAIGMMAAGLAWGIYSLLGKSSKDALADTAFNFLRSLVFVLVLLALSFSHLQFSLSGVFLAVLSGALASGIGYALWYQALPALSAINAAVAQLSVPIIAAIGGLVFVAEPISMRLILSSLLVLGGIFLVVYFKRSDKP